jgi:hypothetical protein
MMKKTLFFHCALAVFLSYGCASPLKRTVSPLLEASKPAVIAIGPVRWEDDKTKEDSDAARLFGVFAAERLGLMGYEARPSEMAEGAEVAGGAQGGGRATLRISVTEWDASEFLNYASLKMAARFELFSDAGEVLWSAEYSTKESDVRLDKDSLEQAVLKAYEPRVQRFVDSILSTLPRAGNEPASEGGRFKWLP